MVLILGSVPIFPKTLVKREWWLCPKKYLNAPCDGHDGRLNIVIHHIVLRMSLWLPAISRAPVPPMFCTREGDTFNSPPCMKVDYRRDVALSFSGLLSYLLKFCTSGDCYIRVIYVHESVVPVLQRRQGRNLPYHVRITRNKPPHRAITYSVDDASYDRVSLFWGSTNHFPSYGSP